MYTLPHSHGILYMPGVLNPISSFTGGKKLDIFLGGNATLFMFSFANILLSRFYVVVLYGM
jgi:hypothetical protein